MNRIIRRYPNRRLYDTEESRYVGLEDLKQLVVKAVPFEVHDSKTHENVTHTILLQILFDQESRSTPLFSNTLLRSFICFYNHPMGASVVAPYLEKSLEVFHDGYKQWTQHLSAEQLTPQAWQQWWKQTAQSWVSPAASSTWNNPWASWWSTFAPSSRGTAPEENDDAVSPKK